MQPNLNLPERYQTGSPVRRTEINFSILQTIKLESNTEYWHYQILEHKAAENWKGVVHYTKQMLILNPNSWSGWLDYCLASAHIDEIEECQKGLISADSLLEDNISDIFHNYLSKENWNYLSNYLETGINDIENQKALVAFSVALRHDVNHETSNPTYTEYPKDYSKIYFYSHYRNQEDSKKLKFINIAIHLNNK